MFEFLKKKQSPKAFSTPEVLFSAFILVIGLVTIVAVLSGSLRNTLASRDAVIASELAQEGIELVRNVRDNDFAAGNPGFSRFSTLNSNCRVDWNDGSASLDCTSSQGLASRYYLQLSGGAYGHYNTNPERFSRYIYVNYTNSGGERATVRSFVYWGVPAHPADLANGNPQNCKLTTNCIFTETFLTAWH